MTEIDILFQSLRELAALSSRAFILYFLSYFAIAYVLYRRRGAAGPFMDYLFPDDIYARKDFAQDALYFCFITVFGCAFGSLIVGFQAEPVQPAPLSWQGYAVLTLADLVVFDFIMFVTHMAQHKIELLWRFHRLHHQPDRLNSFVAFRHHPVDVVLVTAVMALVYAFLPHPEVNVLVLAFYFAGYHLRHAHIPLSYPRGLAAFLISPSDHQRHHSKSPLHPPGNFGLIFSVWDRLVGTYVD